MRRHQINLNLFHTVSLGNGMCFYYLLVTFACGNVVAIPCSMSNVRVSNQTSIHEGALNDGALRMSRVHAKKLIESSSPSKETDEVPHILLSFNFYWKQQLRSRRHHLICAHWNDSTYTELISLYSSREIITIIGTTNGAGLCNNSCEKVSFIAFLNLTKRDEIKWTHLCDGALQ